MYSDMVCEEHPNQIWPHLTASGAVCLGPGMPRWVEENNLATESGASKNTERIVDTQPQRTNRNGDNVDRIKLLFEAGVWIDREGNAERLESMTDDHLRNLHRFLRYWGYTEAADLLREEASLRFLNDYVLCA